MPFVKLDQLDVVERIPGFHGRFIHTDNVTFADWLIREGAIAPVHSHPHEQITYVLEGHFEFTMEGETSILEAGIAAVIPANVVHSGKALTDCHVLDVFYPVREDYC
jgi:quercetin dioxygenase-like cupin family protein